MKKFVNNQHGFTLVELMIVIVIVGILAAVAIPIYQGNIKKAKMSECDAALGTLRTALRVYYAENGNYPEATDADTSYFRQHLSIQEPDLDGRYFTSDNYTLDSDSAASTYIITCTNNDIFPSDPRTLNQDGVFGGGL
jgi:type II secretion system protein G